MQIDMAKADLFSEVVLPFLFLNVSPTAASVFGRTERTTDVPTNSQEQRQSPLRRPRYRTRGHFGSSCELRCKRPRRVSVICTQGSISVGKIRSWRGNKCINTVALRGSDRAV